MAPPSSHPFTYADALPVGEFGRWQGGRGVRLSTFLVAGRLVWEGQEEMVSGAEEESFQRELTERRETGCVFGTSDAESFPW